MQELNLLPSSFTLYRDVSSFFLSLIFFSAEIMGHGIFLLGQNPISFLTGGQFNYRSPCQMVTISTTQFH